ncbi:MAG: 3-methyl-2-oxobutanoate hydroxymethyltransferase [Candidatus Hydrogenedens sp.]|nr:3-methyl-2-oxobutanoate hydroxymethyltransferase [Candidatus Hydrogenedens sp.]
MSQHKVQPFRVTTLTLQKRKRDGEKIAMITAYDFPTAQLVESSDIDVILVGDSVGMAVMGLDDTLSVSMEVMLHHTKMVTRGAKRPLVVADMPFLSYQVNAEEALRNAGRLVAEGGAQAVKVEGSVEKFGDAIRMILRAGIPVMGHIGLTPQSVHQLGGYRVQGRSEADRERLMEEAKGLEAAGCFAVVLECMPPDLAAEISAAISIPTIGIGAGAACDGQVLVLHDMLGWGQTKFTKTFGNVRGELESALAAYAAEVKGVSFPAQEHTYA